MGYLLSAGSQPAIPFATRPEIPLRMIAAKIG
jgi:hypothetical protein